MKKNQKMKVKEKGITLIALVITIIILLILAAVTIAALSGDNGILSNAAKAKKGTERSQVIEQAQIDILGKQADNSSGELKRNDIKEVLDKYVKDVQDDFTSDTVLTTKEEYGNYKIPVSEIYDGEIKESTLKAGDMSEEQKKELIGKYVTNYESASNAAIVTEEGIPGKWMIFNIDDENIYLIASDYINIDYCPTKNGETVIKSSQCPRGAGFYSVANLGKGVYSQYIGASDVTEIGKELNYDYFLNPEKAYTSTNKNMKSVAYMLDTNAWSGFREEGVAKYAIGGPTIELLFEAYNKAHPDEDYSNGKYKARAKNATGYEISTDGGTIWSNEMRGYPNNLYFSDRTFVIESFNNAIGMWLASPSAAGADHIICLTYDGDISYTGAGRSTYPNVGFRPLVCLESSIELKKTGDNTYEIIK